MLRLRLKIDFDTDLTPNITRHSCIILAELVVSSFINNLVRLSSIVPFHIHLSNKLILHTNTTTLSHFFTLWLSILTFPTFSTPANWSRIFMFHTLIAQRCSLITVAFVFQHKNRVIFIERWNRDMSWPGSQITGLGECTGIRAVNAT